MPDATAPAGGQRPDAAAAAGGQRPATTAASTGRRGLAAGFALLIAFCAPLAHADVAGPRDVCETEGLQCETCWEHYGDDPGGNEAFNKCKEALTAKGYTESCRNRQGAGDNVVFCAPGTEAHKVTKGGGCGGCSLGEGAATNALLGVSLTLALLALRRKKSPRD